MVSGRRDVVGLSAVSGAVALCLVCVDRRLALWLSARFSGTIAFAVSAFVLRSLDSLVVTGLGLLLVALVWQRDGAPAWVRRFVAGATGAVVALVGALVLKIAIGRSQVYPPFLRDHTYGIRLFARSADFMAFPSATMAGLTGFVVGLGVGGRRERAGGALVLITVAVALLITSRHWLSDIIGGSYLGAVSGVAVARRVGRGEGLLARRRFRSTSLEETSGAQPMRTAPSTMLRLCLWATAGCLGFGALAAGAYPGGTALDPHAPGYSFSRNFISDLGMTVAHGGQPNRLGAGLFLCSFALLALSMAACAIGFIRLHNQSRRARPFAQAGGAGAMLAGACLLAAALAPENLAPSVHMWAARSATVLALPSLVFLALAAARDDRLVASVSVTWLVLAVTLGVWLAMPSGPAVTTVIGLTVHASVQKAVAFIIVGAVAHQAYRGDQAQILASDEARARPTARVG